MTFCHENDSRVNLITKGYSNGIEIFDCVYITFIYLSR